MLFEQNTSDDRFFFPAGTLVDDCARLLFGELVDSLRDTDGCYDEHDVDHYGDALNSDIRRDVEILAVFAEEATRFAQVGGLEG